MWADACTCACVRMDVCAPFCSGSVAMGCRGRAGEELGCGRMCVHSLVFACMCGGPRVVLQTTAASLERVWEVKTNIKTGKIREGGLCGRRARGPWLACVAACCDAIFFIFFFLSLLCAANEKSHAPLQGVLVRTQGAGSLACLCCRES